MATRSILGSINNAASLSLINGTVDIIANSLSSNSLAPGTTVKTDTAGSLISADLTKSDIVDLGAVLTNPLSGDLDCDGKNITNLGDLEVTTINNRSVLYTPSIVNLNMNNFNINNANNINATTLNSKTPFYQTTTVDLDMNNNAINNVSIINFPTGQYISGQDGSAVNLYTEGDITLACSQVVIGDNIATNYTLPTVRGADSSIMTLGVDGSSSWSNTLSNQVSTNSSNITTLQTKTQYQSVNTLLNSTVFTGIVNGTTTLAVGTAQPNQTGYNLPTARPLLPGYVMVTPSSTGNTLTFQVAADPNKILNQTSVSGVSTTFTGQIIVGDAGLRYTFPNTRGTDGQYLRSDAIGLLSWVGPTYGQISRSNGTETVGYTLAANVMKNAATLTNTTITTHLASSDLSINVADGVIIYNGIPRILKAEISCRFRCGDAKASNGGIATLSLLQFPSTVLISNTIVTQNNIERYYMSCTNMSFYTTGFSFTFGITFDSNLTSNAFLSDISLNIISI